MATLVGFVLGTGVTSAQAVSTQPARAHNVNSCSHTQDRFHCFAVHHSLTTRSATYHSLAAKLGQAPLAPADLQAAYGLPSATAGTDQTVFIVDAYGYPSAAADLAVYRDRFGLPECSIANGCLSIVNQDGATSPLPAADPGWAGETALDLDMVSAVCPNCHITLIQARSAGNDLLTAIHRANVMGAKFVSLSWGGSESSKTNQAALDAAYFAKTGVVYTAASGDDGYSAGVIYPATSSRVVAVGGTSLTKSSTAARGWTESVWSGAGSGCSKVEAKPTWQTFVDTHCTTRGTTDVSAVANPNTGVAVYQTYGASPQGWQMYGGTSAATPIIAAVFALAGTPKSTTSPAQTLYSHPTRLYDVKTGSNGSCSSLLCKGATGWDGPTGLGTPHGVGAFTSVTPTSTTGTVSSGWLDGSARRSTTRLSSVAPASPHPVTSIS